MIENSKG